MPSAIPDTSVDELLSAMQPDACLVVLLCGMAGAGKTTFSQRLEPQDFTRLSIDETMWQRFGRYGIDYPASAYRSLLNTAHAELHDRLRELMVDRVAVVVDAALWKPRLAPALQAVVEQTGGRWQLVYLKVPLDVLRSRLQVRNQRFDAKAPFPITDDILARYVTAFEEPVDEGAIVAVRDGERCCDSFVSNALIVAARSPELHYLHGASSPGSRWTPLSGSAVRSVCCRARRAR